MERIERELCAECGCELVVLVGEETWRPLRLDVSHCIKAHEPGTKGAITARVQCYLAADLLFGKREDRYVRKARV